MRISKRQLGQWLDGLGGVEAALRLRRHFVGPWLPVLTYHRVIDVPAGYPFDADVVDCTPEMFDRQMGLLARHFTPIGVHELRAFLDGEAPLPRNPVMITFDDGYRDNYDHAWPILQRHGLKAVFFIATDAMAHRRVYWWDRVAWICSRAAPGEFRLEYPTRLVLDLHGRRGEATAILLQLIKEQYGLDLERLLDELTRAAGLAWDEHLERELADSLLMTWDQVRALRDGGMDVQSHTRVHRPLHTLDRAALVAELAGSRDDLAAQLGEAPIAIAYPVGQSIAALGRIQRELERAGYRLGFSCGSGVNALWARIDPLDIKRMAAAAEPSFAAFRAALALPLLDGAVG
jgi:peptidoglycan/xylan/chitin deacetylase (PgdA/CDA1 family)